MRVAHVSDCYLPRLGGIEVQVHDLARHQRAAGLGAEVVTATPRARHDRTEHEVVEGVPVHRLTADLPWELPVNPRAGRLVDEVLARGMYDVVHVHHGVVSPFAVPAVRVAVRRGQPTVVTEHCLWGPARWGFAGLDRLTGWSRWPVAWTAVSEAAARDVRAAARPGTVVDTIPNGLDPSLWAVDPLPRDPADVRLVAVMRLAPRKRPRALLQALRAARERLEPSVRLQASIVGDGPERGALQAYLRRHGMAGWVHLAGRRGRAEIRELYRRADVFVSSANLESFGIAALEARCAGVPVVAKAGTGIGEFVRDGRHGLIAADDAGLADAVWRLAADEPERTRMARLSRAEPPAVGWPDVLTRCDTAYGRAASLVAR